MTVYLWINALSGPLNFGTDDNERIQWSVNIEASAQGPITDWPREIRRVLIDAGLVTAGVDVFLSTRADIPTDAGPYVTIVETGGTTDSQTMNNDKYENPTAQVVIRAKDYDLGFSKAQAVKRALDGIHNSTVVA